jgi:hypothetical protein
MRRRTFLVATAAGIGITSLRGGNSPGAEAPKPAPTPRLPSKPASAPPPATTSGSIYVVDYQANAGIAAAGSPVPMFWQSSFTTSDGTLIEWGTGDHNHLGDNGVREFNPLTGKQAYVYPNNNGSKDVQQYDNLQYWYVPRIDALVIPGRKAYSRATGRWSNVVGTGAEDLIRPNSGVALYQFQSDYNGHQAWSGYLDCGVIISGGPGGDNTALQKMWIVVPGSGVGSSPQPYVVTERAIPALVNDASPSKLGGRDGCCFLREYVYWVGGGATVSQAATAHFFRMKITSHLTDTNAAIEIDRLHDAPAAFKFGLLRADPTIDALLCVTDRGIFAYDVPHRTWAVVTPPAYENEFKVPPAKGLMPYGSLGDFIDASGGHTLRRFYFRPGVNHAWEYSDRYQDVMYKRFRSIKLARR